MPKPDNDGYCCGLCKFWLCTDAESMTGICQKAPPVVLLFPDAGEPGTFWPDTYRTDWCGEWKA